MLADLHLQLGDLFNNATGLTEHLELGFNFTDDTLQVLTSLQLDYGQGMETHMPLFQLQSVESCPVLVLKY